MGEAGSRASPPPARRSLAPAGSSGILPQRSPHAAHLLQLFAMIGGGHWTCETERGMCIMNYETLKVKCVTELQKTVFPNNPAPKKFKLI